MTAKKRSKIIRNVIVLTDANFNLDNFTQIRSGYLTFEFMGENSSHAIIGEYTRIRRKGMFLLTTLKIYEWSEIYQLLTPTIKAVIEDREFIINRVTESKVLKFKITGLSLCKYNEDLIIPRLGSYFSQKKVE